MSSLREFIPRVVVVILQIIIIMIIIIKRRIYKLENSKKGVSN